MKFLAWFLHWYAIYVIVVVVLFLIGFAFFTLCEPKDVIHIDDGRVSDE